MTSKGMLRQGCRSSGQWATRGGGAETGGRELRGTGQWRVGERPGTVEIGGRKGSH
jgi:hypothetical protein